MANVPNLMTTPGTNWRSELLRLQLAKTLPMARIHEFLPPYPGDRVPEIPDLRQLYSGIEKQPIGVSFLENPDTAAGSNSWAVSGARSASGKPLAIPRNNTAMTRGWR